MSKNSSTRSASPRKGSSLLAGIIIGMVVGLAIAAGIAWYILKIPNPFVSKEPREAARLAPDAAKPAPAPAAKPASEAAAASGAGEGKPRFEFYKVLTDKQDVAAPAQKGSDKPGAAESKPMPAKAAQPAEKTAAKETYFLQAGAFSNADDADKLKARLAMLGMEANIQTVTIPDKGVWHRVRLGPYKGADEMNKTLAALKQNGVEATPMKAQ
ncbi:MAG: SPOR domain-containing protein [Betaproteobacteria bacterium]|nr:SPOR domain-containing protein [Betaproteobacteria bacterium]MDE2310970.1 SPOR domain-containing protein [Betaproteobacteria bacterium]